MSEAAIGIDIGGTNLRLALIAADGSIISRLRTPSLIVEGREAFCERLLHAIDLLRAEADTLNLKVSGIGAGVPGLVGSNGLIHASVNMRALDGLNLASCILDRTGIPAACANDANVIALGEHHFGAGREFSNFLVITIGTGLGSGLVLEGRLWKGAFGFAAEFGHVTVDPEGEYCPCGNHGCLERYVSAEALRRSLAGMLAVNPDDTAPDSAEQLAFLAREGNEGAVVAFEQMGRWLGVALSSLLNTLNLEAVIICGGVAASMELFEPALRRELADRSFPEMLNGFKIIKGILGDDAGLLGSTTLVSDGICRGF